jgi:hypothetical protein
MFHDCCCMKWRVVDLKGQHSYLTFLLPQNRIGAYSRCEKPIPRMNMEPSLDILITIHDLTMKEIRDTLLYDTFSLLRNALA